MAKNKLLTCLKKRNYLNTPVFERKECVKYGELFQKQGFLSDAIDFFAKAEAKERLEEILPQVITEGDVFLFTKIYQALKRKPSTSDWEKIGEIAFKLGKWQFALKAFQAAENKERTKEIKQLLEKEGMFFSGTSDLPFLKQKTSKLGKRKQK